MSKTFRIAGKIPESIVDGPGIRYVIFAQGCPRHCPGCHNPDTLPFEGGEEADPETILAEIKKNPLLDGVTFSGGEPFSQSAALAELAGRIRELGLNIMTYTGYTLEELQEGQNENKGWKELLEKTDILVDGPFDQTQKSLLLKFRGSANQRLIDVPASIHEGKVILID